MTGAASTSHLTRGYPKKPFKRHEPVAPFIWPLERLWRGVTKAFSPPSKWGNITLVLAQQLGLQELQARSLNILAYAQVQRGHYRLDEATRHLQEGAALAEEIELPGELWSLQAALGEVYLKQGDKEQARDAFGQAATIVRKLADTIEDDERRAAFLASPLLQRVLRYASTL